MNIFQWISNEYKNAKQKRVNKNEFEELLFKAIDDGKITTSEIEELNRKKVEFGLSEEDIKEMRMRVFMQAFVNAKSDAKITKEEEAELEHIQKYLGIADEDIESTKKELARLRLLNEIQNGNLPVARVTNVVLLKNEKVHWVEPASLLEQQVVRKRYEGGSSGVRIRIAKGVSYKIGAHRGHIVSEMGVVPISKGDFILTSKRVMFCGESKSFAVKLEKILNLKPFGDGICLSENNRTKPRLIKYEQEVNGEIIGAILSHSINNYGTEK